MELLDFREPVSAWTHCLWGILSVPATLLLWRRSEGDRVKQVSLLVFGLTPVFCYAGSTLFHAAHDPGLIRLFHTMDHIGIYLLIAGSYTPVAVVLLRGHWRWGVLVIAWMVAALGIGLRLFDRDLPGVVSTSFYLAMGWGAILCYFEMARTLSHRALVPVVAGGVSYSVGAVINLADWPTLVPGVFGPHELFHVFVMVGSFLHFRFMMRFVVPYRRLPVPSASGRALSLERGSPSEMKITI